MKKRPVVPPRRRRLGCAYLIRRPGLNNSSFVSVGMSSVPSRYRRPRHCRRFPGVARPGRSGTPARGAARDGDDGRQSSAVGSPRRVGPFEPVGDNIHRRGRPYLILRHGAGVWLACAVTWGEASAVGMVSAARAVGGKRVAEADTSVASIAPVRRGMFIDDFTMRATQTL